MSQLKKKSQHIPAVSMLSQLMTVRGTKISSNFGFFFPKLTGNLLYLFQGGEKQEALSEQLNKYSLDGWPALPDLLTIGAPRFDDYHFKLESHWTEIVENHQVGDAP